MGEEGRGNEGKKSPTPSPSFKKKNLFSLLSLYWQRTFTGLTLGAAASAAPASESPLPLPLWRLLVLTACRRKREKKKEEEGGELKKVSGAKRKHFFSPHPASISPYQRTLDLIAASPASPATATGFIFGAFWGLAALTLTGATAAASPASPAPPLLLPRRSRDAVAVPARARTARARTVVRETIVWKGR